MLIKSNLNLCVIHFQGSVKGVPGNEYRVAPTYFGNSSLNEGNWCFEVSRVSCKLSKSEAFDRSSADKFYEYQIQQNSSLYNIKFIIAKK